jgi:3-oxoacyl-[acyl-carrier protein] reductase
MADEILSNHSEIDVLINCAGMSLYGLFTDFDSVQRNKIFQVNVLSMMNLTRKILPSMIRKQSGKIVNITSMWGETGASCEVDYSATKSAIIGFTKALAKETGLSGVRVNAVSPGVIKTEMMSSFTNEDIEVLKEETPVGRIGLPEDVANAVAFLVSDKADFITGEVLKVNGGFLI